MAEQDNTYERGKAPMIQGFTPGLPEVGKIKIGTKGEWRKTIDGKKEYQLPQKLDHFLITSMDRDTKTGNFLKDEEIHAQLGDKPKSIPIMFLYNDTTLNFQSRFTCYDGKTLWCSGDGVAAHRLKENSDDRVEVQCPCERSRPGFKGRGVCKPYGILSVIIRGAKRVGGVWKFRTTSYNNCRNIPSAMQFVKAVTKGQLMGVPLDLVIEPQLTTIADGTQKKLQLVKILYTEGDIQALAEAGYQAALTDERADKRMQLVEKEAMRMLTAEIVTDADVITDEYYPEEFEGSTVKGDQEPARTAELEPESAPEIVDPAKKADKPKTRRKKADPKPPPEPQEPPEEIEAQEAEVIEPEPEPEPEPPEEVAADSEPDAPAEPETEEESEEDLSFF